MGSSSGLPLFGRGSEQGQATVLAVALIAVAATVLVVGAAFVGALADIQRADGVARIARAAYSGDIPVSRASAIAAANGATSTSIVLIDGVPGIRVELPVRSPAWAVVGREHVVAEIPLHPAAESARGGGGSGHASPTLAAAGGVYTGPLVAVDSAVVCPRVARAYRAMQSAAAASGVHFTATSGYRSYAQQAVLYAALGPAIAAPPGTSLHHAATELDIAVGPAGSPAHRWLQANGPTHGFIQRYSWEPWHWGNVRGC